MRKLLFIFIITIIALPTQLFGQWYNGNTDAGDLYYAATVNDSGNLLGEYCSPETGNCVWLLGMKTVCKEGDNYPVLANSDTGAVHIMVNCSAKLDSGLYRYVFTDFDVIEGIVKKGLKVGFAVPLQSDQFRVVRFNLGDSNRAIAVMHDAVNKAKNSSSKTTGTKDENL